MPVRFAAPSLYISLLIRSLTVPASFVLAANGVRRRVMTSCRNCGLVLEIHRSGDGTLQVGICEQFGYCVCNCNTCANSYYGIIRILDYSHDTLVHGVGIASPSVHLELRDETPDGFHRLGFPVT